MFIPIERFSVILFPLRSLPFIHVRAAMISSAITVMMTTVIVVGDGRNDDHETSEPIEEAKAMLGLVGLDLLPWDWASDACPPLVMPHGCDGLASEVAFTRAMGEAARNATWELLRVYEEGLLSRGAAEARLDATWELGRMLCIARFSHCRAFSARGDEGDLGENFRVAQASVMRGCSALRSAVLRALGPVGLRDTEALGTTENACILAGFADLLERLVAIPPENMSHAGGPLPFQGHVPTQWSGIAPEQNFDSGLLHDSQDTGAQRRRRRQRQSRARPQYARIALPVQPALVSRRTGCGSVAATTQSSVIWPAAGFPGESPRYMRSVEDGFAFHGPGLRTLSFPSMLRILEKHRALTGWVVNLGAAERDDPLVCDLEGAIWPDPGNCLVRRGWHGVLLEADPMARKVLRETFHIHEDEDEDAVVRILPGLPPWDVGEAVMSVLRGPVQPQPPMEASDRSEAMKSSMMATATHDLGRTSTSFEVDLLKIDVDNGDCDYLEALLEAGLRPLLVHIELLLRQVPPPIAARRRYDPEIHDEITRGGDWRRAAPSDAGIARHGCSLAAAISLTRGGYVLLQLEASDAVLVRRDVAPLFPSLAHLGVGAGKAEEDLLGKWQVYYWCLPTLLTSRNHPAELDFADMLGNDVSVWADERVPAGLRMELVRSFLEGRTPYVKHLRGGAPVDVWIHDDQEPPSYLSRVPEEMRPMALR